MKLIDPEYRITLGTIGWAVLLFMAIWNTVTGDKLDATIVTTIGGASTLLLGVGIIKKHKSFNE